jgi:hypothetical protein
MEKHQKVFVAAKRLIIAVDIRNSDLTLCCNTFNDDEEERQFHIRKLAESQKEIDESIQYFRDVTEGRFKDFSNVEIAFIVHIWSGIWSNTSSLRIDSNDVMSIVGHNRIEDAADFVFAMFGGSSPLFAYISMHWSAETRGSGLYRFAIHNPDGLNHLMFGKDK